MDTVRAARSAVHRERRLSDDAALAHAIGR